MYYNTNFSKCKTKWKLRSCFEKLCFLISSFPTNNYLFKVSDWITRTTCENCLSGVFIVKCEYVSQFLLIVDFKQANVCYILKRQTLLKTRSGLSCVMLYFKCKPNVLTNLIWTYTRTTLKANQWKIMKIADSSYKKRLRFKMICCTFAVLQILLTGGLIRSY